MDEPDTPSCHSSGPPRGKNDQFVDEIETKSSFLRQPMQKIGGLWVRAIEEPTFHQKMWGLQVTAETISKNMGSLEPYIHVTSIMGGPPDKIIFCSYFAVEPGISVVICSIVDQQSPKWVSITLYKQILIRTNLKIFCTPVTFRKSIPLGGALT